MHVIKQALALLVFLYASQTWADVPSLPLEDVRETYELPTSQYVDLDGVSVHYIDEGVGDTVILLHASYHSLRSWDPIAALLKDRFRVVRLDFANAGLTGPDPQELNSIERNIDLLERLIQKLRLEKFALVGTSSGGVVAFRYAAENTDKVSRLVLINSAGLPRTPRTNPLGDPGSARRQQIEEVNKSRSYWHGLLDNNFIGDHTPPTWMVDMAYDMNRREGLGEELQRYTRAYKTGDPKTVLAQITSPTMIIWGMNNPTVVHLEADVYQHWLTSAPSLVRKVPNTGHYPYVEEPEIFNTLIGDFVTGALNVRHQSIWNRRVDKLRESLAHHVC